MMSKKSTLLSKFSGIRHGFTTRFNRGLGTRTIFPHQVHGAGVIWAGRKNTVDADAILTDNPTLSIGIKTADCVPILLFEYKKKIVGAIHAGWRGTQLLIAHHVIYELVKKGGDVKSTIVVLGPSIGPCCYDKEEEITNKFPASTIEKREGKLFLDLRKANVQQLLEAGILREHIEVLPWCTSCDNDMFYSYRKEKPLNGQNSSYISLR